MAEERCTIDIMNDPDSLSHFFESSGTGYDDGEQSALDSSVAELFDGFVEDYPALSLSAEDMTNGDDWNFMPMGQPAVVMDSTTSSVQSPWLQSHVGVASQSYATGMEQHIQSGYYTAQSLTSSQSSAVVMTNQQLAFSDSSTMPQGVASFTMASSPVQPNMTGSAVNVQYLRGPAAVGSPSPSQRSPYVQAQVTPQQHQRLQMLQQQQQLQQQIQQQQQQQHIQQQQVQQLHVAAAPTITAGSGNNGLTLIQMPNGQLVLQQQQQQQATTQHVMGNGQIVIQQQPSGGVQQLMLQMQQQQGMQQQTVLGTQGGQIMLQVPQQQHQMTSQYVIQQQQPGVQQQGFTSATAGVAPRSQINLSSIRGIRLPNGEVQLVGATSAQQPGLVGSGSIQNQSQQVLLQHQQPSVTRVMQGTGGVVQQHGNVGGSNVVYQTVPMQHGGTGCISATNFVQINQFTAGSLPQQQQVSQQADQPSILLSLNQSGSPAPAATDQFTDRGEAAGGNDVLVQINGQTYRLHNVQQTPPAAASPPVQIIPNTMQSASQMNARPVIRPQSRPVQLMRTSAQPVHPVFTSMGSSSSLASLRQMTALQGPPQARLATPAQSSMMTGQQMQQSRQPVPQATNQTVDATLAPQTITLTQSQLTAIQQAPPDKQVKLLQILQRQQMIRAAAAASAIPTSQPDLSNGHSVLSSSGRPQGSPAGARIAPVSSLPPPTQSQSTSSSSFRSMVSLPKSASPVSVPVRPGQGVMMAAGQSPSMYRLQSRTPTVLARSVVPVSGTTTTVPQIVTTMRPVLSQAAVSNAAFVGGQLTSSVADRTTQFSEQVSVPGTSSTSISSTAGVAKVTTVQLTTQQQTLLLKVQSQLQTLSKVPQRTAEQERFVQMLLNAQQQILTQGRAQLQAASLRAGSAAPSAVIAPTQLSSRSSAVSSTLAVASLRTPSSAAVPRPNVSTLTPVACRSELSTVNTITAAAQKPSVLPTTVSSKPAADGNPSVLGASSNLENLFRAFPNFREKLEAEFAKMTPERREWIKSNQSLIFAKLQQRQLELQQTSGQVTAGGPLTSENKLVAVDQPSSSVAQSAAGNTTIVSNASLLSATAPTLTRKQLFQMYLLKDQKRATHPDLKTPFENQKDILKRLVPFHVLQTGMDSDAKNEAADTVYEEHAQLLLDRKDAMLKKYRHLLLLESMKVDSSADAVMLGRMFLNDERNQLKEDRRLASEDPDLFVPRPVLRPTKMDVDGIKVENQIVSRNFEEGLGDSKIGIKLESEYDKTDDDSTGLPSSEYTVRPAKGLSFVFKSQSNPAAQSQSPHSILSRLRDPSVRDVRVKLERCDDDALSSAPSSPKRARTTAKVTELRGFEAGSTGSASEDDAAVASLLGCSALRSCFDLREGPKVSAVQDRDGFSNGGSRDAESYVVDDEPDSMFMQTEAEVGEQVELFADGQLNLDYHGEEELFGDFEGETDDAMESYPLLSNEMPLRGHLISAVGDFLGETSDNPEAHLGNFTGEGRYVHVSSDASASEAVLDGCEEYQAINIIIGFEQNSASHGSISSSFYDQLRLGADHDSDLDAAVQSILT